MGVGSETNRKKAGCVCGVCERKAMGGYHTILYMIHKIQISISFASFESHQIGAQYFGFGWQMVYTDFLSMLAFHLKVARLHMTMMVT